MPTEVLDHIKMLVDVVSSLMTASILFHLMHQDRSILKSFLVPHRTRSSKNFIVSSTFTLALTLLYRVGKVGLSRALTCP